MQETLQAVFIANRLTKTYQMGEVEVTALRALDREIYQGEFIVLLGLSGSGKPTLLNLRRKRHNSSNGRPTIRFRLMIGYSNRTYMSCVANMPRHRNMPLTDSPSNGEVTSYEYPSTIQSFNRLSWFGALPNPILQRHKPGNTHSRVCEDDSSPHLIK